NGGTNGALNVGAADLLDYSNRAGAVGVNLTSNTAIVNAPGTAPTVINSFGGTATGITGGFTAIEGLTGNDAPQGIITNTTPHTTLTGLGNVVTSSTAPTTTWTVSDQNQGNVTYTFSVQTAAGPPVV